MAIKLAEIRQQCVAMEIKHLSSAGVSALVDWAERAISLLDEAFRLHVPSCYGKEPIDKCLGCRINELLKEID